MKLIIKKTVVAFLAALCVFPLGLFLTACSVDFREDSEIYSCYYYGVDGVDLTSEIVSYTLELRTDGSLITRYKTNKNSDSGKDEYYFEDDYIVVSAFYGKKKYHLAGNEIIIGEFVDGQFVLIKFRLTKSQKPATADMYSAVSMTQDGTDVTKQLKYLVASIDEAGDFGLWLWYGDSRLSHSGSTEQFDWGYALNESEKTDQEGNILPSKQWTLQAQGEEYTLIGEEGEEFCLVKTQNMGESW